jgi:uncharacterized protein
VTAAYFDSSAIVKLYANELHHEEVRAFAGVPICTSLARVEITAAFFGKARSGEISVTVAEVLDDVFRADWTERRFLHVAPDERIETEAARLASVYLVRGFDAVHLATAIAARRAVPESTLFVCFDKRLNTAAVSEQFELLPIARQPSRKISES